MMDFTSDRILRMACTWLANRNRAVMEVSINRSSRSQQQPSSSSDAAVARASMAQNSRMSATTLGMVDAAKAAATALVTQSSIKRQQKQNEHHQFHHHHQQQQQQHHHHEQQIQKQHYNTIPASPTSSDKSTTLLTSSCHVCLTRRVNSLCSNHSCKSCCAQKGRLTCNVHKKTGEEPPKASPNTLLLTSSPSTSSPIVAVTPTSKNLKAISKSKKSATATPTTPTANTLQHSASQFQVPCPFCNVQVSTRSSHFALHIQSCRRGFLEQNPRLMQLTMPQLFQACWGYARRGQPIPVFTSPTTATTTNTSLTNTHDSSPVALTLSPKTELTPQTQKKTSLLMVPAPIAPAGIGPSYSDAELQRAVIWENSARNVPPHIAELLPPAVVEKNYTGIDKRLSDSEFEVLCDEARGNDDIADVDAARKRARQTHNDMIALFAPAYTQKPKLKKSAHARASLAMLKCWLKHKRLAVLASSDKESADANLCKKRWQTFSDQSLRILQKIRQVATPYDIKSVVAAFSLTHGRTWRAQMPSNVQIRRKLPVRGAKPILVNLS